MRGVTSILLLFCLISGAAGQQVSGFEAGGKTKTLDCGALREPQSAVVAACFPQAGNSPLRCIDPKVDDVAAFCADAAARSTGVSFERIDNIARDVSSGMSRAGARRAGGDACLPGLPEGDLLLPSGQLTIDPAAAGAGTLTDVTLSEDRGNRSLAIGTVDAGGHRIDAEPLRGGVWFLRGKSGSTVFGCRFRVVAGNEARRLTEQFAPLQRPGPAATLEQAAFFRANRFTYEYWRTIDGIRKP